ncbi:hypothetical protein NQK81_39295 [Amycolatopsis roodepoortensis]|uniref:hypothetical protein n=1 Tax=Amycolatopsis roodepoortensis TaxID=700274 RepID=UPI00214C6C0D|nr:hypothetical protein [Amycolatopsis roodepoortensis]UUV30747.1 hypothetical protein NQK81_39295 [Amycolatopsis roodepoortensis]
MADVNGNLGRVSAGRLNDILAEAVARSLGHAPDLHHVREAARLVGAKSATIDWEALVWVEATDFDGSVIPEEIRPLRAPFWTLQTTRERTTVNAVLARRSPQASAVLSNCLEEADTQDIVYPDQSPEYTEVVREVLTLLSDVYADQNRVTPERLENVLYEALARCFGEPPEEQRVVFLSGSPDSSLGTRPSRVSRDDEGDGLKRARVVQQAWSASCSARDWRCC